MPDTTVSAHPTSRTWPCPQQRAELLVCKFQVICNHARALLQPTQVTAQTLCQQRGHVMQQRLDCALVLAVLRGGQAGRQQAVVGGGRAHIRAGRATCWHAMQDLPHLPQTRSRQ